MVVIKFTRDSKKTPTLTLPLSGGGKREAPIGIIDFLPGGEPLRQECRDEGRHRGIEIAGSAHDADVA